MQRVACYDIIWNAECYLYYFVLCMCYIHLHLQPRVHSSFVRWNVLPRGYIALYVTITYYILLFDDIIIILLYIIHYIIIYYNRTQCIELLHIVSDK